MCPTLISLDDYKKIIKKEKYLSKYKFDWNIKRIIPLIQKMVDAKKRIIDKFFFKSMINIYLEDIVCTPEPYLNGWILQFFAYINNYDKKLYLLKANQ